MSHIPPALILPVSFFAAVSLSACSQDDLPLNDAVPLEPTPLQITQKTPDSSIDLSIFTNEMNRAAVVSSWFGAKKRLSNEGLPKNSRQTSEGYWLGSRPDKNQIEELYARNIRLILPVSTVPKQDLRIMQQTLQELGITHIYLPFGSKFPHPSRFMPIIESFPPSQIFIHCEHGSDRTGAIMAFILTKRHQWPLAKALYSVILPEYKDISTLTHVLINNGFDVSPNDYQDIIGIYSAEKNDGYGGMKVREDGGKYINLIQTLIKRAAAH